MFAAGLPLRDWRKFDLNRFARTAGKKVGLAEAVGMRRSALPVDRWIGLMEVERRRQFDQMVGYGNPVLAMKQLWKFARPGG